MPGSPQPAMGNPGPRRRVLIIDDEEPMRLLLAQFVQQDLGVEVTLAGTCEAAERLLRDNKYDVILLDLLMPGIGGVELLKRLRAESANRTTPVVIVSIRIDHPDAIERQLGHAELDGVRRAYARGEHWDERVRMMAHWSDHLDQLRSGAKVLQGTFRKPPAPKCAAAKRG